LDCEKVVEYRFSRPALWQVVACLTCIGECCLWCLEKFLDFINKNAYIQVLLLLSSLLLLSLELSDATIYEP